MRTLAQKKTGTNANLVVSFVCIHDESSPDG